MCKHTHTLDPIYSMVQVTMHTYINVHTLYLTSLVVSLEIHFHISDASNSLDRGTISSLQASSTFTDATVGLQTHLCNRILNSMHNYNI